MSKHFGFSVAPGVGAAFTNMNDNRAYHKFTGDADQLGSIYQTLLAADFKVVKSGFYPGFPKDQEDEYRRALQFVFDRLINGWWGQHSDLIKYQICTEEEFGEALDKVVEDSHVF